MKNFWRDIKYGFRMLLKNPGFALIAVATLAIGIGANAAIFSVISSVLLRPYPYQDADRLMVLRMANVKRGISDVDLSYDDFRNIRERSTAFQEMSLYTLRRYNLSGAGEAAPVKGAVTTANIFTLIGGPAMLGRTFSPEEEKPGGGKVVVISRGLWQRIFASDKSVVGRQMRLDEEPYTIIGVVAPEAQFPDTREADLFVPLAIDPAQAPRSRSFFALARLKSDVPVQGAQAELSGIAKQLAQEQPETNEGWGVQVASLRDYRTKDAQSPLKILFGAVGLVLLIACVNVANLMLQRGAARQQEMGVRTALGASPARLLRQLFTESLLIAVLASALGLFLSHWMLQLIVRLIPADELPGYLNGFEIDQAVIFYLLIVSVLTAVLFGLVPAARITRVDLTESLKGTSRGATAGRGRHRLRSVMIVSEVALSLMLLVAAGLMVKSFQNMQRVDFGFDPRETMAVAFSLPETRYKDNPARVAFYQKAVENLRDMPGVRNVGAGSRLPIGDWIKSIFNVEGLSPEAQKGSPVVDIQSISGDYFQAVGVKLVKGRAFTAQDGPNAPPVVIVNESVARRFWPEQDPLGKRVKLTQTQENWATVVGVVSNTQRGAFNKNSTLEVYAPYEQRTRGDMVLFVRAASDPLAMVSAVRSRLGSLDSNLALEFRTIQQASQDALWANRLLSSLFGLFAVIAVILASIGIYGTVSYAVSQRVQEIGIRMALGAGPLSVLRLILRQGVVLSVFGIVVGLGGAVALTRVLASLLFGVGNNDPLTFTGSAVLLGVIALLATLIPAYRATKVDPLSALRQS